VRPSRRRGAARLRQPRRAIDFSDPETAERYRAHRQALNERKTTFDGIVRRKASAHHGPADSLFPWITPDIDSKRFDTRFFLAWLPDCQVR
jgi:hypothetical protein